MCRMSWLWAVCLALVAGLLVLSSAGAADAPKSDSPAVKADSAAPKAEPKKEPISEKDVPAAVMKVIKDAYPKCTVDGQEVLKVAPLTIYYIEVETMGEPEREVGVTSDGTIVEIETVVDLKGIPAAAAKAIEKAADGLKITEVAKVEVRSELKKDGETWKLVKLEKPMTVYGADLAKPGLKGEIRVAEDGTVVKPLAWRSTAPEAKKPA